MVQERVTHFVPLELSKEVILGVGFKCLVEADNINIPYNLRGCPGYPWIRPCLLHLKEEAEYQSNIHQSKEEISHPNAKEAIAYHLRQILPPEAAKRLLDADHHRPPKQQFRPS
ncbi:hypothetical protein F3Y22_tig00110557pilonHSYRG00022 [Hibiscus syriacus]|uniref:Uncharacterized protein n=1 Tax=Hibiscus syriacus TaxID=106335 RepID=A0A6A3A8X4_HIBSY|nr:hypothetical protein F3Y22_tig00110557pilonHSYRG00022 [Hibiscus syriacus]